MTKRRFAFGPFTFDSASLMLARDGNAVRLGARSASILRVLLEADGAIVTKSALLDAAWPGLAVEESNLTVQVAALRRALDQHDGERWIETVSRSGYRFVFRADPARMAQAMSQSSIAIMPFATLGMHAEEAVLVEGFMDDLIVDLAKISGLTVIARRSSVASQGRTIDVMDVARELEVRYLIKGSFRYSLGGIRVAVQLIDGLTGAVIWAERFDRRRAEAFLLHDELAGSLTAAVTGAPPKFKLRQRSGSSEAYDIFARGRAPALARTVPGASVLRAPAIGADDGRHAIGSAIDLVLWLPRFWKARSELGDLVGMGARECQDMGLTGCDIERVLTPPNPWRKREAH